MPTNSREAPTWLIGLVLLGGCGSGSAPEEVPRWEGPEFHMHIQGVIEGKPIDLLHTGAEVTPKTLKVQLRYCVDNIVAPTRAQLFEIEVNTLGDVVERSLPGYSKVEFAFGPRDFQRDPLGSPISIAPADPRLPYLEGAMFSLLTIENKDTDEVFYKKTAEDGLFALQKREGTPDDIGVIPDEQGVMGASFRLRFSTTDEVAVSFNAPTEENKYRMAPIECRFTDEASETL